MRSIDFENERKFENSKVLNSDVRISQSKFYWATKLSIESHQKLINKIIEGKRVLEIGCSSGYDAEEYIKYCDSYVGVDISNIAIEEANKRRLKNSVFIFSDAHQLPFKSDEFDYVIVNSLLHHMDLNVILKEIHRVLTKGGGLLFREPLGTNPIFQFYRLITPKARTIDEKPFSLSDIRLMKRYFSFKDIQWFGFLVIFSGYFRNNSLRAILTKIDSSLSSTPLRYLFWQFSGMMIKKD